MTAAEAKGMTQGFGEPRDNIIQAIRGCFDRAIEAAAMKKEWLIYFHEVSKLRTPVSPVEYAKVYQLLRQDGFRVDENAETVRWDRP